MILSIQIILILIVIVSYILVIAVTFKSRRTTSELEGLVRDLKVKEVTKIKTAIVPEKERVGFPERRVVHEKIVTRRRIEEMRPRVREIKKMITESRPEEKEIVVEEAPAEMEIKIETQPKPKVIAYDPMGEKIRRELKSQLIKSRGKLATTLDEQLKKGIISRRTYEELVKRTSRVGKAPGVKKKAEDLLESLRKQYESGAISLETYIKSKRSLEAKLR